MDRHREEQHAGGSRLQKKEKKQKAPKEKRKSRLTRQQKILIAVAVILALVLAVVVACQSLFVRPDLNNKKNTSDDQETEELDYGDGVRPRSDGERKSEDFYTVLILGRDTGGGGNTDTMLLASYDVTNQKATVMSIPRDTMVNVPWDIKRINSVYNYYGGGEKGIQHLYKEISQLVGFEPDYQVVVEWEAVGEIVDAMGGVWFDVPRNMNYDDPYQDLSIHINKGYQLLDGEGAMGVLRYRHDNNMKYGYPDGDLGRIKTQQAFLTAMLEQLLKLENITKVNEFVKVFQKNVETDLSLQNILWFAKSAYLGGLKMENVNFVTMPNKNVSCWSRTYHSYQSYVTPVADELLDLVNNELSPFVEKFTYSDLDIMSVNSDGSVSSSTGYVEDSKAAQPPVKNNSSTQTQQPSDTQTGETGAETGETTPGTGTEGGITGGETGGGSTTLPETGGETTGGETGGGTGGTTSGGETTTPPQEGGETGGTESGSASGETGGTTTGGSTQSSGETGSGEQAPSTPDPGFSVIEPAPAA